MAKAFKKQLPFVTLLSILPLSACTQNELATQTVKQNSVDSAPNFVSFEQPKLRSTDKLNPNGHPDQRLVPQGLCVVNESGNCAPIGKLDRSKPTVLYTHGWTKTGESENVESAKKWTPKFNVLLFRWHHSSFDSHLVPHDAEARIWAEQGDGRGPVYLFASSEFKRLADALGKDYKQEIRFVGHSLGAQVVVALASQLEKINSPLKPKRIELLDPAVIGLNTFEKGNIPEMGGNPTGQITASKAFRSQIISIKVKNEMPFKSDHKVLISYLSATGLLDFRFKEEADVRSDSSAIDPEDRKVKMCLVRDLFLKGHTQKLAGGLFGLAKLWASLNETERHQAIRKYYFESIDQKLPILEGGTTAFSAAKSTQSILDLPRQVHYEQVKGADTVTIADDSYAQLFPEVECLANITYGDSETKIFVPVWKMRW
jgi:hypothetical protein